ncbi:hypothetical protein KX928_04750 [Roseobacter sp. YSTF-M11]|uniref:Uncharacterized protein n=1 Tax=Roseobacter insulae TaxID=2859783 RepID=A0A9X1FT09_9RHOB|nr:hypothetical protein [Roseobacter insulae]MBW4707092.1 hypothetical protein [Roseobacter insulae]
MNYLPSVIIAGVAVAAAWISFGIGFENVNLTALGVTDIGQKFLTIIFVALFIERAVEVVVSANHGSQEADLTDEVTAARIVKENAAKAVLAARSSGAGEKEAEAAFVSAVELHQQRVSEAVKELKPLKEKKAFTATLASVVISAFAAVIGFRILGQFVVGEFSSAIKNETQQVWFSALDILITTLVLAGGADGIHNTIGQYLKRQGELTNGS